MAVPRLGSRGNACAVTLPNCLLSLVLLVLDCPAWSANSDSARAAEIRFYNAGNLNGALAAGTKALTLNPKDATARYYLAGTLLKMGRTGEAAQQYAQCAALSNDPKLQAYCRQAITNIVPPPPILPGSTGQTARATPQSPPPPSADAIELAKECQKQVAFRRQRADADIAKLNADIAEKLRGVEPYYYRNLNVGGTFVNQQYPNPQYEELFQRLRSEADIKISDINEQYEKDKGRIVESYQKRAAAYKMSLPEIR